jgi:hypothetical protein
MSPEIDNFFIKKKLGVNKGLLSENAGFLLRDILNQMLQDNWFSITYMKRIGHQWYISDEGRKVLNSLMSDSTKKVVKSPAKNKKKEVKTDETIIKTKKVSPRKG